MVTSNYTWDMFSFGFRAHDFGRSEPEQMAERLAAYGPLSIQLALPKAFLRVPAEPGVITHEYARRVKDIFGQRGITIAVLGCYINPVHPDRQERECQLDRFEEHLRFARDFGCRVVGTETGSLNADSSWNPGTQAPHVFDTLCDSVSRLVSVAERSDSIVGIEPVADQHTLSSIERTAALLRRIDSPALGIIFDPVNLIPLRGLDESQMSFFRRAFAAFGERIVAVHAKDFRMIDGHKSEALPAGQGEFNYALFFEMLKVIRPDVPVILENVSPSTARDALAFLRRMATL